MTDLSRNSDNDYFEAVRRADAKFNTLFGLTAEARRNHAMSVKPATKVAVDRERDIQSVAEGRSTASPFAMALSETDQGQSRLLGGFAFDVVPAWWRSHYQMLLTQHPHGELQLELHGFPAACEYSVSDLVVEGAGFKQEDIPSDFDYPVSYFLPLALPDQNADLPRRVVLTVKISHLGSPREAYIQGIWDAQEYEK